MDAAPPSSIEIPSRLFGTYRIRSRLGTGGQADVFLAEAVDERGEPLQVALKVLKAGVSEEAFAGEADLMGMLQHPNLVRRLEVGNAAGRFFIAMEYLTAGDLTRLLEAHRRVSPTLPVAASLYLIIEVLRALAYFHQAATRTGRPLDLVHSDVNPSNVFFSAGGEVKLGDLGVATSRSEAAQLGPAEGLSAGKLNYLSPEQTRGEALTPASDLFAVGVVLHELLVGTHPFRSEADDEKSAVVARIRAGLTEAPKGLPSRLTGILQRALAPRPDARFATAGEFAAALFAVALDGNQAWTSRDFSDFLAATVG